MLLCTDQACQQQAMLLSVCLVAISQGYMQITIRLLLGYYLVTRARLPKKLKWSAPLHHSGVLCIVQGRQQQAPSLLYSLGCGASCDSSDYIHTSTAPVCISCHHEERSHSGHTQVTVRLQGPGHSRSCATKFTHLVIHSLYQCL